MFVYDCFEGDDLDLACVQHDLYFGCSLPPPYAMVQGSTLGLWWYVLMLRARQRKSQIPWLQRNWDRLGKVDGFSHKNLQAPHEHIAAYYRWMRRDDVRPTGLAADREQYRLNAMRSWFGYVKGELYDLMNDDDALITTAKIILYRYLDASDRPSEILDEMLVTRYGLECVANTWRARDSRFLNLRETA